MEFDKDKAVEFCKWLDTRIYMLNAGIFFTDEEAIRVFRCKSFAFDVLTEFRKTFNNKENKA